MILVDTDVLSAARRSDRALKAAAWLAGQEEADLFLSAITLGEIERGIASPAVAMPASPAISGAGFTGP